ncbi:MAG TPA: hypothetical protein VGH83_02300 [Candidatus Acidoferrum sp.]
MSSSGAIAPAARGVAPSGFSGVRSSSLASPRATSRGFSPSGSHLVYYRSASGQLMMRRVAGARLGTRTGTIGTRSRAAQLAATRGLGDSRSVPGLGFDYSHLAATHPNRFHGRRGRNNDGAVLFPFLGGGGYFLPTGPDVLTDAGEGQPVEEAEEEENPGPADRPPVMRGVDRMPQLGPPAPQTDVPEYVFVRRDGTVFFAVAYTWEDGSLRYVSSEGLRRSVARDTLDINATQQFNEQRGMTFRAPA